jgi:hypothetical protein
MIPTTDRDRLIRARCPNLSDADVETAGEALDAYIDFVIALRNRLRSKSQIPLLPS